MIEISKFDYAKQVLYITRGLSGSGKSTLAQQICEISKGKVKQVNRDSLRKMLDFNDWSKKFNPTNEKFVTAMRDELMGQILLAGFSVINSDTNLGINNVNHFKQMAAKWKVGFELIDLIDVPLATCVRQDLRRLDSVGKDVIVQQWYNYNAKNVKPVEHNEFIPNAWIFDIDGTLAHSEGIRGPFEEAKYDLDTPDFSVSSVLWALKDRGDLIIILSGREGSQLAESKTKEWLKSNAIQYDHLYMRAAGDSRDDTIIKREIYESKLKFRFNILGIFDDREKVVNMWRTEGIKVFNVGLPYNFDAVR